MFKVLFKRLTSLKLWNTVQMVSLQTFRTHPETNWQDLLMKLHIRNILCPYSRFLGFQEFPSGVLLVSKLPEEFFASSETLL